MTYRIAGFFSALLLSVGIASAEVKAKPGWATSESYDEALAFAKKTGKPITVIFAFKDTGCPLHDGSFDQMTSDKSLANTVKVVVWVDDKTADKASIAKFKEFTDASRTEKVFVPQLFLLDSQGRLTGEVGYGKEETIKTEVAKVSEITIWEAASRKQIAKADKDAAAGRFKAALAAIEKIDAEDRAATTAITAALKGQPAPAADKPKSKSAAKKGADSGATVAKASPPQLPAGRYFPELLKTKREAYEKLASDRLAEARAKADGKDVSGARKLLTPMVADAADLPPVAEAKTLLEGLPGAGKKG